VRDGSFGAAPGGAILAPAMRRGTIQAGLLVVLSVAAACGASRKGEGTAQPASSAVADAGEDAPATEASAPRAMAATPQEAQELIQAQVQARMKALWTCIEDYRARIGKPRETVAVDIGIDQEGTLLGVTSPDAKKGPLDPALQRCLTTTLHGAPFPRSHAGVITVRQTFSDVAVSP